MITPEDTALLKLESYRFGGVSDGLEPHPGRSANIAAGRLDDPYLDHWAADIGVKDLLDRIRAEV